MDQRDNSVEIAVLKEKIKMLEDKIDDLELEVKENNKNINEKLDKIIKDIEQSKGGFKTLIWVGSAMVGLSTIVGFALSYFKFKV